MIFIIERAKIGWDGSKPCKNAYQVHNYYETIVIYDDYVE